MKNKLKKEITTAIEVVFGEKAVLALLTIEVEYTKNDNFGDYTTNVSMNLAKVLQKNPMEIAEMIKTQIIQQNCFELKKIEVASPGYINFYLAESYLQNVIRQILEKKDEFLQATEKKTEKISNEFISANPTGPLHLGNGRGGFYGDVLSRILRKRGWEVVNEYYINDAGEQVMKLGHSVLKDDQAVYGGEYIDDLHNKIGNLVDVKEIGQQAADFIVENIIKKTIQEKMGIIFNVWMSEKKLYEKSYVDRAIEKLRERKMTYEKDGALWLRTIDFGDDKDRVLIKSDGQKTYFASDCGYILNKIERGFDRIIEIWGADHHGYIVRFQAAARALGFSGELKFLIMQLVRLVKDGKEVRMSKRAGNVVYVDDLIDELGLDIARFFFLMYSPDAHMNFDLGLAKERSAKNPVFYVQYAHARICSILRNVHGQAMDLQQGDLSKLVNEKELALMKELSKLPEILDEIAISYEVHKIIHYVIKLADRFHSFYNDCKVIDENNLALTQARLALLNATKIIMAETLELIGVSAPEKM